jgi:stage V sporulation protein R
MGMFHVQDDTSDPTMVVQSIHDERGYRRVRRSLARQYDIAHSDLDLQVVDVDMSGDRRLILQHRVINRVLLEEKSAKATLQHLADLWGYEVVLVEVSAETDSEVRRVSARPAEDNPILA